MHNKVAVSRKNLAINKLASSASTNRPHKVGNLIMLTIRDISFHFISMAKHRKLSHEPENAIVVMRCNVRGANAEAEIHFNTIVRDLFADSFDKI